MNAPIAQQLLKQPQQFLGKPCLIAAADAVRVQECADALRAAAKAQGYAQIERVDASDKKYDWDELRAVCVSPGLFAARRVLDLRLAEAKLSAAGSKVLVDCLTASDPDLQWIISLAEWSRRAEQEPWVKTVTQLGNVVSMWPLRNDELPKWVAAQAHKRDLSLAAEATELLLWRTEGNLLATVMELDKLALAHPGSHWSVEQLNDYVADSARFDLFKLIDEAIYGNAARMRRVLRALKAEGEVLPRMLPWIARQLQLIHQLAVQSQRGGSVDQLLRSAQVYPPRAAHYQRAARRHSPARWEQLWIDLAQLDRQSKGRAQGSPWVTLERLLLQVALSDADGQRFVA